MREIKISGTIINNSQKWIYDYFGEESTCPNDIEKALKDANGEEVKVIVSSGGGDLISGNEIRYLLKNYNGDLTIHNVSLAASAAAVICTARKCTAEPTSMFMWHNVSLSASGDYNVMDHTSEILKTANKSVAAALVEKTGKSEEECLEIMNKETWFTAQEAKEIGIVDEIIENTNINNNQSNKVNLKLTASFANIIPESVINKMKAKRESKNKSLNEKFINLKYRGLQNEI